MHQSRWTARNFDVVKQKREKTLPNDSHTARSLHPRIEKMALLAPSRLFALAIPQATLIPIVDY